MSKIKTVHRIDVSTASFPYLLILDSKVAQYDVYGTRALSANIAINPSGTPKEGMVVSISYSAIITTSTTAGLVPTYSVTFFGAAIPYSYMAKKIKIFAEYKNAAWSVYMLPSVDTVPFIQRDLLDPAIVDDATLAISGTTGKIIVKPGGIGHTEMGADAIEADNLKNKEVTLAKMADIARGSMILGNSAGVPAAFSAKTSGAMLLGDGTDLTSVVPTGDVTVSAAGVWAIGANKVLDAMVNTGALLNRAINAAAGIVFTKMVALTASMIPQINASGFIESSNIAVRLMPFPARKDR